MSFLLLRLHQKSWTTLVVALALLSEGEDLGVFACPGFLLRTYDTIEGS